MSISNGDNEWKLKINGIFLSQRGIINSAKNYSAWPKFKLNLLILLTHLHVYTEFQFKMSISDGDNEWKLKIMEFF